MDKILEKVIRVLGWINIVFISVLTLLTISDVFARYLFNTSFFDAMTLSSYFLAMINALALPGITWKRGHVQVDLIYDKLPAGLQRFCDGMNNLLAAALFFSMSWYAFIRAFDSFKGHFFQGWMKLPEYPPRLVFACGCLITAFTFLALFLRALRNETANDDPPAPETTAAGAPPDSGLQAEN